MNVYTGLLFLHGHIVDADLFAGYSAGYGNRVANARAARESWEQGEALELEAAPDAVDAAPRRAA